MTIPDVKIACGDCLEVMHNVEDKSITMILCDLPFGTTNNKWDVIIPFEPLWKHYHRVCKSAIVLHAMQPFTSLLVCSNLMKFKYDWTWRKPKGTGHLNAKIQPLRDKEDILVFYDKCLTYNPQFTEGKPYKKEKVGKVSTSDSYNHYDGTRNDNDGFRYPKQVLEFGVVEQGTIHPTQKPVDLLEYLIKTYTNEGDTVLDNCMGSRSTGIACINTNRNFIGIEKEKPIFEKASNRLYDRLEEIKNAIL